MNTEELREYEKLSPTGKDFYNIGMRNHPEWSHAQAFTYAQICEIAGGNPPNDPKKTLKEIFEGILIKTQGIIKQEFPRLYSQVKDYFTNAIAWLKIAVDITIKNILEFFK